MKSRAGLYIFLLLLGAAILWFTWSRPSPDANHQKASFPPPKQSQILKPSFSGAEAKRNVIVIQTGEARMSNALRGLEYLLEIANQLPKERVGIKSHLTALGGVLFFDDCLMAKMTNGYINTSTNELRQNYSNMVAKLFAEKVSPDLLARINQPGMSQSANLSSDARFQMEKNARQFPELAVAFGFDGSFYDRNNLHMSLDEQYQSMLQSPPTKRELNAITSAIQQAGVTDVPQSDLKELCIAICGTRTSAYLIYGPQSQAASPEEYNAYAESLNKVFQWRLENMYGLNPISAQSLVQALNLVPVDSFSRAGSQVPAYIY